MSRPKPTSRTSDTLQEPLLVQQDGENEIELDESEKSFKLSNASFYALCLIGLLDTIEYGIIMPTLFNYLKDTKKDVGTDVTNAYGLILSIFSVASLCAKPFIGWWSDRSSYLLIFVITSLIATAGNVLYFFARAIAAKSSWEYSGEVTILIARVLSGIGCANTSLTFAYVARTVAPNERTGKMSMLSIVKMSGMLLGPACNLITSQISNGATGDQFVIDDLNSPGLFVAVFQIIVVLVLWATLEEPPPYEEEEETDEPNIQSSSITQFLSFCTPFIFLCFYNVFYYNASIGVFEAMIVPITAHAFGWNGLQNSMLFFVIPIISVAGNVFVMRTAKVISDVNFLAFAAAFGLVAPVLSYFELYWDMESWKFVLILMLMVFPIPFAFGPNRALFTRLVEGSHNQGLLSSMLSVISSVGGIIGPNVVGLAMHIPERKQSGTSNIDTLSASNSTYIIHEHIPVSNEVVYILIGAACFTLVVNVGIGKFMNSPLSAVSDGTEEEDMVDEEERLEL